MLKKYLLVTVVAAAFTSPSFAMDWLQESEKIMREAARQQMPEWLKPAQVSPQSQAIIDEITDNGIAVVEKVQKQQTQNAKAQYQAAPDKTKSKTDRPLILASFSMPHAALQDLLEEAYETNSVVAFRGVPKGGKIFEIGNRVMAILKDKDKLPSVIINPIVFKDLRVSEVPVVVYPVKGSDKVATIRGLINIDWIGRTVGDGRHLSSLDLGRHGMTWEVSEPDFIEEMKRRIMDVDWDAMKGNAVKNFWGSRKYYEIPSARQNNSFSFDPTMIAPKDIRNSEGRILVPIGTAINPLKYMPLTKRYIFFDARSPEQVKIANRLKEEAWKSGRGASLIMANFDVKTGWDGFESLNNQLKSPVLLLNDMVKTRFRIKALPSMAEAKGDRIVVTEFEVRK